MTEPLLFPMINQPSPNRSAMPPRLRGERFSIDGFLRGELGKPAFEGSSYYRRPDEEFTASSMPFRNTDGSAKPLHVWY